MKKIVLISLLFLVFSIALFAVDIEFKDASDIGTAQHAIAVDPFTDIETSVVVLINENKDQLFIFYVDKTYIEISFQVMSFGYPVFNGYHDLQYRFDKKDANNITCTSSSNGLSINLGYDQETFLSELKTCEKLLLRVQTAYGVQYQMEFDLAGLLPEIEAIGL